MRLRQTTLSPLLRSLAAFALVVFVAAQGMCFVHCNFGVGQDNGDAQPSCHASAPAKLHPNGHDAPDPAPTASCSTLKTMLAGGDAPTLVAPQLHTVYLLAPMTLSLDEIEVESRGSISRQVRTRDWVLTPEVCLGPAFRSLAPPSLA